MSEIGTLSLERLNNGAHFLFISNVLARAEADTNLKSKLSTQIASLKSAKEQEDEDLWWYGGFEEPNRTAHERQFSACIRYRSAH